MSTRIRLVIVGGALAALSVFGVGTALASSGGAGQAPANVQPVQQEQPAQEQPRDHDCPNKSGAEQDASQQV